MNSSPTDVALTELLRDPYLEETSVYWAWKQELLNSPMPLIFNALEIVGIGLSVVVLAFVVYDGESNWFEGMQLIAVYLVLALVFFFVPAF